MCVVVVVVSFCCIYVLLFGSIWLDWKRCRLGSHCSRRKTGVLKSVVKRNLLFTVWLENSSQKGSSTLMRWLVPSNPCGNWEVNSKSKMWSIISFYLNLRIVWTLNECWNLNLDHMTRVWWCFREL